ARFPRSSIRSWPFSGVKTIASIRPRSISEASRRVSARWSAAASPSTLLQQSVLPVLQIRHPVLQLGTLHAIDDCFDDLLNLALDAFQLALGAAQTGPLLHSEPVHLPGELAANSSKKSFRINLSCKALSTRSSTSCR